jgi:hypothetical protein
VLAALNRGDELLLVHECSTDDGYHAVDFGAFFSTTPQPLLDAGIYGPIAIALKSAPYREASFAVLGAALSPNSTKNSTKKRRSSSVVGLGELSAALRRFRPPDAQRLLEESIGRKAGRRGSARTSVKRAGRRGSAVGVDEEMGAAGAPAPPPPAPTANNGSAANRPEVSPPLIENAAVPVEHV